MVGDDDVRIVACQNKRELRWKIVNILYETLADIHN
jgi:hypothetical protein